MNRSSDRASSCRGRHPTSALSAVLVSLAISFVAWAFAVASVPRGTRHLLLLGDSTIANYRLPVGSRLEDELATRLGPGWTVRSGAGPGTHPGVFYLNLSEAELFGFRPDLVVFAFAPRKLGESSPQRFGPSNQDLRWLPLDREGRDLYRRLDPQLQRQAIVDKAGLLFLFLDLLDKPLRDHVTWPRSRMRVRREDPAALERAILADAEAQGHRWTERMHLGTYEQFAASQTVLDLEFFLERLAHRRIPSIYVAMPQTHPGLAPRTFPAAAQTNLARAREHTLAFMHDHAVPVVDFGTPEHAPAFGPERWGDIWHLKSPEAYRHIARGIVGRIHGATERSASPW